MKTEEQVCSLELAKKLRELGVEQNGLIYWFDIPNMYEKGKLMFPRSKAYLSLDKHGTFSTKESGQKIIEENTYSAFTVSELLERMPKRIELEDDWVELTISPVEVFGQWNWLVKYYGIRDRHHLLTEKYLAFENLADSLATKYIYLLENKIVEK